MPLAGGGKVIHGVGWIGGERLAHRLAVGHVELMVGFDDLVTARAQSASDRPPVGCGKPGDGTRVGLATIGLGGQGNSDTIFRACELKSKAGIRLLGSGVRPVPLAFPVDGS